MLAGGDSSPPPHQLCLFPPPAPREVHLCGASQLQAAGRAPLRAVRQHEALRARGGRHPTGPVPVQHQLPWQLSGAEVCLMQGVASSRFSHPFKQNPEFPPKNSRKPLFLPVNIKNITSFILLQQFTSSDKKRSCDFDVFQ